MLTRRRIYEIVEPAKQGDTIGYIYDFAMIVIIIASVIPLAFKEQNIVFIWIERVAVIIFIIDYLLRLLTADYNMPKRGKLAFLMYPFKPMAIIDLLSILPSLLLVSNSFVLLRTLRLLRTFRVFRIFKLFRYSKSFSRISNVLKKQKSALLAVGTLAVGYIVISALIVFNVEPESFNTFFDAVYWATISLTTVGYGDIYPVTPVGQIVTMVSSILGIAIVALPAGIITAGYMEELHDKVEESRKNAE